MVDVVTLTDTDRRDGPVCIAGMHRSGTSALGQALGALGRYLGPSAELTAPAPDNTNGFWEHRAFVELNDSILG